MWLWAILRFKRPTRTYNHFEVGYTDVMSSGAVEDGIENRPFKTYLKEHPVLEVAEYEIFVTKKEYRNALKYVHESRGIKYEISNFIFHAIKIFTGLWLGSKTSKKLFCYEYGIRFLNHVKGYRLDPYMNPYEFKLWADKTLGSCHLKRTQDFFQ